jgi:hypothetical protein
LDERLLLALLLAVTVPLQLWLAAHPACIGGQTLLALQGDLYCSDYRMQFDTLRIIV